VKPSISDRQSFLASSYVGLLTPLGRCFNSLRSGVSIDLLWSKATLVFPNLTKPSVLFDDFTSNRKRRRKAGKKDDCWASSPSVTSSATSSAKWGLENCTSQKNPARRIHPNHSHPRLAKSLPHRDRERERMRMTCPISVILESPSVVCSFCVR
jgi:hypothetical protein